MRRLETRLTPLTIPLRVASPSQSRLSPQRKLIGTLAMHEVGCKKKEDQAGGLQAANGGGSMGAPGEQPAPAPHSAGPDESRVVSIYMRATSSNGSCCNAIDGYDEPSNGQCADECACCVSASPSPCQSATPEQLLTVVERQRRAASHATLVGRLKGRISDGLPSLLRARRSLPASPNHTVTSASVSTCASTATASSSASASLAKRLKLTAFSQPATNNTSINNNNNPNSRHDSINLAASQGGGAAPCDPSLRRLLLPPHLRGDEALRQHQASRPSIAGVGGTVTTVTKSRRKTAPLPRLVAKNGTVNLFINNIDRRQYVRDLFTTMIDIKWRYNLLAASLGFVFSWLFFACVWYLVLLVHRDLEPHESQKWLACIENVHSFSEALLFSIETQSTLGFGSRIISVECPGAIIIFCIQLIFGLIVECLIVGMVFAKLSRPAKRSQTIMFSKCATVCLRGGRPCLTFRVGDVRSKSHIIGASIRASLVSQKVTEEGEHIPFYHHQLQVKTDDSKDSLLLIWPVIIVHIIDESSPFFKLNAEQLASFNFEIITVLEGTVESTGQSIQVRSSYLPSEVRWGFRFEPIVSTHGFGKYAQTIIDYNKFNKIYPVDMPTCSAWDAHMRTGADFDSETSNMNYQAQKQLQLTSLTSNTNNTNNNNNDSNNNNLRRLQQSPLMTNLILDASDKS